MTEPVEQSDHVLKCVCLCRATEDAACYRIAFDPMSKKMSKMKNGIVRCQ